MSLYTSFTRYYLIDLFWQIHGRLVYHNEMVDNISIPFVTSLSNDETG